MLTAKLVERMRAFQESRALPTAVELNAFTAVGDGATAEEAAARMGSGACAAGMLLKALAAIGALLKRGEAFAVDPKARPLMDGPGSARLAMIHTVNLWERWSTLTECLRRGTAVSRRLNMLASIGRRAA